jgi:hypothetical protein
MVPPVTPIEESQVAQEILRYLIEHPDAKDTFEGIAEWWLLERTIQQQKLEVKLELIELAARKLILERRGNDGHVYYRVNPRKKKQIAALIRPSSA